jgi:hypothetical protein
MKIERQLEPKGCRLGNAPYTSHMVKKEKD